MRRESAESVWRVRLGKASERQDERGGRLSAPHICSLGKVWKMRCDALYKRARFRADSHRLATKGRRQV